MCDNTFRTVAISVAALLALLISACTSSSHEHSEPMASAVTMKNQWASSAESGMTAVFGTLANTGHHDARIVGAQSPVAGRVEVHEVVPDETGGKVMRPKDGGLVIPAGETRELIPGGDHLMLMDLKQPLQPGSDVALSVEFEDGSTLPVTAQVRDFSGANENYAPAGGGTDGAPHHHG